MFSFCGSGVVEQGSCYCVCIACFAFPCSLVVFKNVYVIYAANYVYRRVACIIIIRRYFCLSMVLTTL